MYLRKGDAFELAATYNSPPALVEERARAPYILQPGSPPDRMVRTKSAVHIVDLASSEFYLSGDPRSVAGVELGGVRTLVLVPMLKDAEVVGHFAIFRQEVKPFTERQIELVKNFAAQAVIAIENTRLLNELRQRTDDLTESLQQQTATADVLTVIASSTGELAPVFSAMLANAAKLCEATYGVLWLREGDAFRTAALHGPFPQPISIGYALGPCSVQVPKWFCPEWPHPGNHSKCQAISAVTHFRLPLRRSQAFGPFSSCQ